MTDKPEIDRRETVEVKLDFPFTFDGQRYESLTMRRPKARDSFTAQRVKGGEMERGLHMLASLCEQPQEVILECDEVDLEKLQEQYGAFTGRIANP